MVGLTISNPFWTTRRGSLILLKTGTLRVLPPDIIPGGIPVTLMLVRYATLDSSLEIAKTHI